MPGRFIGETVLLLQNVVDYATAHNIPSALISLDQEKAFDQVDWPFLLKTLRVMGFSPTFLQWIKTFYTDVLSNVQVTEVLACNIRACPHIKGFPLPGPDLQKSVINQYADNTTLTVTTDDSIHEVFRHLQSL